MIAQLLCPGLLDTGAISETLMVIRDGMVNSYILKTPDGLVCIDTGWRTNGVLRGFEALGLNIHSVRSIFLTHMHWDHARCLPLFQNAEIFVGEHEVLPKAIQKLPTANLTRVKGDQIVSVGGIPVQAIYTPGHTSGSVSYLTSHSLLFTGDTLRIKDGRILPFPFWLNRDNGTLRQSIRMLAAIDSAQCVLTAHHGVTRDIAHAFSHWRKAMSTPLKGGEAQ